MRIFTVLLLALLPYTLSAESGEWFLGLEAGATGISPSGQSGLDALEYAPEYGLKAGLRDENGRIYIGVTAADNIGTEVTKTLNPYIALEGISDEFKVIAKSMAKFYFGVRLGASIAEINNVSTTAALAGMQTGLVFLLPADFEIELAYRHYWTFKDTATDFNAGSLYGGLNYKFGAF